MGEDEGKTESETTERDKAFQRFTRRTELFRTLMDRDDEAFLRKKLSRSEFFHLKRVRIRVAWNCVRHFASFSAEMMQVATMVRRYSRGKDAQTAKEVAEMAWRINAQCLIAFAKLALEYLFPAIRVSFSFGRRPPE